HRYGGTKCQRLACDRFVCSDRRICLLRRTASVACTRDRRGLDRQPHDLGTVSTDLHRTDLAIRWDCLSQALPGPTGLRAWGALRRPKGYPTTTPDLLVSRHGAGRPVGRAIARTTVLLRGNFHANTISVGPTCPTCQRPRRP